MKKFRRKVGKNVNQSYLVALIFYTKLCKKLAVFQTMLFVPSQEMNSITGSWKAPKLGMIAHHYLLSNTVLDILEIRFLSHFFTAIFRKNAQFADMKCFESYLDTETKIPGTVL